MPIVNRILDFVALGSERPVRRLIAYYAILILAVMGLFQVFPFLDRLFSGERLDQLTTTPQLLQDGMTSQGLAGEVSSRVELTLTTSLVFVGTVALMLPVTWVYMSVRRGGHDQSMVQTLIILPIIVAGIILLVRNSLALAFSLAGVMGAVRFRTSFSDVRDTTFVFLAIAVGFAAGVQVLTVALLLSLVFNFLVLLTWRYDFGRNVLAPSAAAQWAEPLKAIAETGEESTVPDRDLVLALTPKKAQALSERFDRLRAVLGSNGEKPRYNAVLSIRATSTGEAQRHVETVLERITKRWRLDEIVTNEGKPSEIFYLVKVRKPMTRDEFLTAIRAGAANKFEDADLEIGEAVDKERGDERARRKARETA